MWLARGDKASGCVNNTLFVPFVAGAFVILQPPVAFAGEERKKGEWRINVDECGCLMWLFSGRIYGCISVSLLIMGDPLRVRRVI